MACCASLCKCCSETIIVILGVLSVLVSLPIIILGFFFVFVPNVSAFKDVLSELFKTVLKETKFNADEILKYVMSSVQVVGIVLLTIGFFIMLFALLGCCGACCHSNCLMATYSLFLGITAVTLLSAVIALALSPSFALEPIAYTMYSSVSSNFNDPLHYINNSNANAKPIDYVATAVMQKFQCCGVHNYTDFRHGSWNRNYTYEGYNFTAEVPAGCCDLRNGTQPETLYNCMVHPNSTNSNFEQPCYQELSPYLQYWLTMTLIVVGIVSGFLMLLFVSSIFVTCIGAARKARKEIEKANQYYVYPNQGTKFASALQYQQNSHQLEGKY